ncbi:MAG TPA: hypothetical protein VFQ07_11050 [Candidatus Polarisedimenticolia bacterium]|nr:hypothetical protein [Candidatus Polarisedimenticolia bacterium]
MPTETPPHASSRARPARPALAVALLGACALLSEASAADAVRLRYGFKPQAAYEQALGLNLTMTIDPASVPAPLLTLLQSMTGEIKQEVTSKARLQTKTRNADGSLPFEYKIVEAKGTLTQGGQTRPIPSLEQAAAKPPSQGHVSADGRQAILDASDTATEGIPKRVRERVADSLPVLPDKELRPGETFETKTTMTLPGPSGKGERQVQAVWLYTLKTVTRKEATFDVKQTLPEGAAMTVGQGQKMEMAGGGKGSAVFDLANGAFRSIQVDLDLTMTVDVPLPAGLTMSPDASPGTGTQPGTTGGAPAPTRIKVLVRGPMTMTLGPA